MNYLRESFHIELYGQLALWCGTGLNTYKYSSYIKQICVNLIFKLILDSGFKRMRKGFTPQASKTKVQN